MSTCPSASIMQKVPGGVKGVSVLFPFSKLLLGPEAFPISYFLFHSPFSFSKAPLKCIVLRVSKLRNRLYAKMASFFGRKIRIILNKKKSVVFSSFAFSA
jgi:hypothetical protein